MQLTAVSDSNFRGFSVLFCPLGEAIMHSMHEHIQKIKINTLLKIILKLKILYSNNTDIKYIYMSIVSVYVINTYYIDIYN